MTTIASLLQDRLLLLDGGMGTQIFKHEPTVDDFGGAAYEGCVELLNERRPDWIRGIHASYFEAGSDAVETNTFGCNELVLAEFGLAERCFDLNVAAAKLAREAAADFEGPRFVIGSVGPGTKLLTLGQTDYGALLRSYRTQVSGLLAGGVDAVLIETCQDLGQIKVAVRAAKEAMAEARRRVPLWVQATVETTGTLLVGSEIGAVLASLEALGVDVLGLNCATGPEEMRPHLQVLSRQSPVPLSCLPNAGLPRNEGGRVVYPLGPEAFADQVAAAAREMGVAILGGCCGTGPEHIRALKARVGGLAAPRREPVLERGAASLYAAVPFAQEPRPLLVGERTNANGSKAFRDLLAKEDWDGLVEIAKGQAKEGAHLLDVCVAYVGRDEVRDMDQYLQRLVTQVQLPLMLDSTEVPVLERALQRAPGKCVVNSINFEDGEAKARKVLELCRTYGAAVVGLTIDERGMAKTAADKLAVAERLHALAVGEFGLAPGDLILDPLTFTLGSGEEGFRRSAVETLDAIRAIKATLPGVLTLLGVSNVSFGLAPGPRKILNALMLHHAVAAGLDLAIFNAAKLLPVAKLDAETRQAFEDLLFDRRREGYDPLKVILERHADAAVAAAPADLSRLSVEERLQLDILDGEKRRVLADLDEALAGGAEPLRLINEVLLEGMKVVGERFGRGEMQLPFVLESAEAMKAAIRHLEPRLPKDADTRKGRILLATVKGDVHDIGKNLVDIILTNNGFEVRNLGIKQPVEAILRELEAWPADAVGLSGLLVKSTVVMKENLEELERKGLKVPVLLGGAALTREYVEGDCRRAYSGPVLYAADAFEGLRHMQALVSGDGVTLPAPPTAPAIRVVRRGDAGVALTPEGRSAWVQDQPAAAPPFWGVQEVDLRFDELFGHLDTFVVLRNRWGFTQGALSDEAFAAVLKETAEPELARWRARFESEDRLRPKARYGYFPCRGEGDLLVVLDPADPDRERLRIPFPRQASGRRLAIPDFFRADRDVVAFQLVTLGEGAAAQDRELYAAEGYRDYFLFHGLATELVEAGAEALHARIRRELGIAGRDLPGRALFAQGYQGSRYSFGYPACPDLEGNGAILDLLDGEALGVRLTESFQMDPEFTTSALVAAHPQARYFNAG
ncbi:MAG TPA: methionine synthase [Holophagaceae bacterium]|nr:methionine synthase [Holophagaceae bacterium]